MSSLYKVAEWQSSSNFEGMLNYVILRQNSVCVVSEVINHLEVPAKIQMLTQDLSCTSIFQNVNLWTGINFKALTSEASQIYGIFILFQVSFEFYDKPYKKSQFRELDSKEKYLSLKVHIKSWVKRSRIIFAAAYLHQTMISKRSTIYLTNVFDHSDKNATETQNSGWVS